MTDKPPVDLLPASKVTAELVTGREGAEEQRRVALMWVGWNSGSSKHTRRGRSADIRKFGRFLHGDDLDGPKAEVPIFGAMLVYRMLRSGRVESNAVMARFLDWMTERGDKRTTKARAITSLRNWAEHLRVSEAVPDNLSHIPVPSFDPYNNATGPDMDRIVRALDELRVVRDEEPGTVKGDLAARDYAILCLFTMGLMRKNELRALRWKDVKTDDKVKGPYVEFVGKGDRSRKTGIGDAGLEALNAWHVRLTARYGPPKASSFIFVHVANPSKRVGETWIYEISRRLIGTGPHGVRHTGATAIGVQNLLAANHKLGHKRLDTTKVYIDKISETDAEAVEILGDLIGKTR